MELGDVARQRVAEPLLKERAVALDDVYVTSAGIREPWSLVVTQGKAQPYGVLDAGRVLVLLPDAHLDSLPLAGLVWTKERGKKYIHQVWVDPEVQRRGLGKVLVEAYQRHISPSVVMKGPFSAAGRAFAKSIGAKVRS